MKTRKALKQEAKTLILSDYKKALGLNIVPILLIVLTGITVALALGMFTVLIFNSGDFMNSVKETSENNFDASGFFVNMIGIIFTSGIMYQMLDWFRGDRDFNVVSGMFTGFKRKYVWGILMIYIIQVVFRFFWTMLFIIPGIIKSYSYSQAYYIYKDCVDKGQTSERSFVDYITMSRQLMDGHKFEYFVLQLSFIGWWLLVLFTAGLAAFWVVPYQNATMMAYYDNLTKETL